MDPNTQRAEAERWLGIAVKLLSARDFLGSKTFAIRAREAQPNNGISDQILAVVDTVLAGEHRLSTSQQPDWYAVLQLPRLVRDPELIANHYRRLAMLLNPDHNRLPFADYALQLAMEAWSVLSEPTKKWLFDNELAMSLQRPEPAPVRVDPVRVDPIPSAASTQLNTFQFFQPQAAPPPPTHHQQSQTLPTWQQQPQQQSHREFMSQPQSQMSMSPPPFQQQAQQLLPQWQMRDPTPVKGVAERSKVPVNGAGVATSSHSSAAPPLQPQQNVQPVPPPPVTTAWAAPEPVVRAPKPPPMDGNANNTNNDDSSNNPNFAPAPGPVSETHCEDDVVEEVESFWTSCPYCLYVFEYQKLYLDCTLRCQNCRRAFHAVQIPNPPPTGKEEDTVQESSFCCWGFFPLGFSMTAWKKYNQSKNANGSSNWVPFSPMFKTPTQKGDGNFHWFASGGGGNAKAGFGGRKNVGTKTGVTGNSAPRVYVDDDAYIDLSEPSDMDSSDRDWRNRFKKKKARRGRGGGKRGRPHKVKKLNQGNDNFPRGGGVSLGGDNLEDGSEAPDLVVGLVAGDRTDTSKNVANPPSRKQTRRTAKDMGRLDLNVEFNNEGEDHAPAVRAVNGEEDGIETIGFFEGLDEFLSTLPILNVDGDEKSKPS